MAAMKAVAGHAALFLVVPITAALLIWATFGIGRKLGSASLGLGAAWLVATSPAFLTMIKEPMSDVPAAAFWALATWKVLDESDRARRLPASPTAMAILIRPNLVPLAAVLGAWMLWPSSARTSAGDRIRAASAFAAARRPRVSRDRVDQSDALRFTARIRIRQHRRSLFGRQRVTNIARYGAWLAETQTPLVFAGLLALIVPSTRLWPARSRCEARGPARSGHDHAVVFAMYAFYMPFDAWWFLRLLLPAWPALCIGTAAVLRAASQIRGNTRRDVQAIAHHRARPLHGLHREPAASVS